MSDRILAATRKGLFTIERASSGWKIANAQFLGSTAGLVHRDERSGELYVALGHGHFGAKLHKSTDDGKTWVEIESPKYPEKPEGEEDKDGMGRDIKWATEAIWAMASGGADQPGLLWAGTIPGGLFRSQDAGASWELMRNLWDNPLRKEWFGGGAEGAGIHTICVDPRDSKHVVIAVSCGGVWATSDGGESWELRGEGMRAEFMPEDKIHYPNTQDAHQIAMCRANPDTIWLQHHNGIFLSRDAGRNFTEIANVQPSVFGFGVAVHPNDPNRAWFVPARKDEYRYACEGQVVVTRTRDGGKSFEVLREGLPQEHAYDITYRHALAIDDSGDRLAFGTTTGSLWVTENQGDSWHTVGEHLPPVYCVRFA
ncbi:MAG: exo-alpha-sialidase [Planctomycetes bacterium]|nr:exo-alpha-sialidase [Planctomycetota bacterium]